MMRRIATAALLLASMTGCRGDEPQATSPNTTEGFLSPQSTVSAKNVQDWIEKWCTVNPGDSRAHLRAVLGPPTNDFGDQDQWEAFDVSLVAFYDTDFNVSTLQTDTQQWSVADKARLHCDEHRGS